MHNMIRIFLAATLLSGAAVVPAMAQPQSASDVTGSAAAIRDAAAARRAELSPPPIASGRNFAGTRPSTLGVEPYIARTIERNARGDS